MPWLPLSAGLSSESRVAEVEEAPASGAGRLPRTKNWRGFSLGSSRELAALGLAVSSSGATEPFRGSLPLPTLQ